VGFTLWWNTDYFPLGTRIADLMANMLFLGLALQLRGIFDF
jgi:hypothetical protein